MSAADWFDQTVPCPRCGHFNVDHAACTATLRGEVVDPPCMCTHPAHFTGDLDPEAVLS